MARNAGRNGSRFSKVLLWPLLLIGILWTSLALWFDGPPTPWTASALSAAFSITCLLLLVLVRPFFRTVLLVLGALLLVLGWWSQIPARSDRDWSPDVAQLPRATVTGSRVTIEHVRNFEYRTETDYAERWETRSHDFDHLRGVDMFLSF